MVALTRINDTHHWTDCIYFNFKTLQKIEIIFMGFRMNEISIDDEIKEIIDETSKWTKLFESFWNVFQKYSTFILDGET